jgi:hypothetical protein
LPVTVKEVYTKLIAHWKAKQDEVASEFMSQYIESEYAAVSADDMYLPAHAGTECPYSQIGTDPDFPPILVVNPEYYNKKLPRSTIQFLYFRIINNRPFLKSRTAESLKGNSISYNLYWFEESLDIQTVQSLLPLINKWEELKIIKITAGYRNRYHFHFAFQINFFEKRNNCNLSTLLIPIE